MCQSLLRVLLCLYLASLAAAVQSGFGKKKEPFPVIQSDIKHIKCQVCQMIAKQVHRSVTSLQAEQPHWKKLSEEEILTHLESMCNSQKEEGEWITKLDVQQQGDELKVVEMSQMGDCRRECATVAKICTDVLGEHDTDVSELLVQGKGRADISNALCHELSGACSSANAKLKYEGTRELDEDFVPVDESQIKLQRMLAQMEGDGMSGNIFSRDEAMAQVEEYRDELEDYDMTPEDLKTMAAQQAGGDNTAEYDAGAADEL